MMSLENEKITKKFKMSNFENIDDTNRFTPTKKSQLRIALQLYNVNKNDAIWTFGKIDTWDVSRITDMLALFSRLNNFDENINSWDTSNVTNMSNMFFGCVKFNNGGQPLEINTSNVTNMCGMFRSCRNLNIELRIDTSNVTDMSSMFCECGRFNNGNDFNILNSPTNSTPVLSFNTARVTKMNHMFCECTNFNCFVLFDTSNVTDMSFMFSECTNFNNGCTDQLYYITDINDMFNRPGSITHDQNIDFDTTNIQDISFMFQNKEVIVDKINKIEKQIQIENYSLIFNTSSVTNMNFMFYECLNFNNGVSTNVDIGINPLDFDTSNVIFIEKILGGCPKFNRVCSWNLDNVIDIPVLKLDNPEHITVNQRILRRDNNMTLEDPIPFLIK